MVVMVQMDVEILVHCLIEEPKEEIQFHISKSSAIKFIVPRSSSHRLVVTNT